MVLQQYVDKIDPSKISLAQLNARLAAGNSSSGSNGSIAPSKGAPEESSILGRMLERLQRSPGKNRSPPAPCYCLVVGSSFMR